MISPRNLMCSHCCLHINKNTIQTSEHHQNKQIANYGNPTNIIMTHIRIASPTQWQFFLEVRNESCPMNLTSDVGVHLLKKWSTKKSLFLVDGCSAKCSVKVCSSNSPLDNSTICKIFFRQSVVWPNIFRQGIFQQNVRVPEKKPSHHRYIVCKV